MAELYADLVEKGLRSLDGENGIIKVPIELIEKVKKVLEERLTK